MAGVDNIVEEFRYIIDVMKKVAEMNEKSNGGEMAEWAATQNKVGRCRLHL